MIESEARAKLASLVAETVFPTLEPTEVDRLLREARRTDRDDHVPSEDDEWAPNFAYAIDDVLVPTVRNGHQYKVTASDGLSGATQPTWPTGAGATVTLDGVTYTENGTDGVWEGTWDLNRAAAEGWRIKAGLVSNRHDFGSNQGNYNPAQVFEHCMKMADYYASKSISSIKVESGRWDGRGGLPGAHLPWAK